MTISLRSRALAAITAAGAIGLASPFAHAAADCGSLPNPVFVTGSSAVKPLLVALGNALSKASTPTTIVYVGQGSCTGVAAILDGTPLMGTALYWDGVNTGDQMCSLDAAGVTADIGVSDVFATSCPNTTVPADVGDFFGPVQVMNFAVPKASTQTNISAEAAYFVYGFGAAGMVAPWTDDNLIEQRSDTSGTQQMLSAAIKVPAAKWHGTKNGKSGDLLTSLTSSMNAEASIGILASDVVDGNRDKIRGLQYQHYGQTCAYSPDSTSTAFDKRNVRDGHYPVWGPLHLLAKTDNGNPASAGAAEVIGYFTGAPPDGLSMVDIEIGAHTVPLCAMNVSRTEEVGPMSSVAPTGACGCYFESKATGAAPATCTTCSGDGDCKNPNATHCNYGYCEAS